jgi:hypothetical protein
MKLFSFIIGLVLLMTSCEYSYEYSYKVTNKSNSEIYVNIKTFRIDTTFFILKDSSKVLVTSNHGIEGSHGPYFENVKIDLDKFIVTKNDNVKSNRDYLMNDAWTFTKEPSCKGLYSAIVTNDEFNK